MADFKLTSTVQYTPRGDFGQFIEVKVTPAVRQAVQDSVDLVVDEAKSIAPVDTGYMRDHISGTVTDGEKTILGTVVSEAFYSGFVEFGTYKMEAQPFMRPALDTLREQIRQAFSSNLSVTLKS